LCHVYAYDLKNRFAVHDNGCSGSLHARF
jgi:hypothetical protein